MITPGFCPGRASTQCLARCWTAPKPGAPCLKRDGGLALPAPAPSATPHEWGLFLRHASQRTTLPTSGFGGKGGGLYVPGLLFSSSPWPPRWLQRGTRAGRCPWHSRPPAVPEPGRGRRADGGAALHPSGRRAPANRIPGGKRDPPGSLHIPQTILSLPTATAPSPPQRLSVTKTFLVLQPLWCLPLSCFPSVPVFLQQHCSQRKSWHKDCGTGFGELLAADTGTHE